MKSKSEFFWFLAGAIIVAPFYAYPIVGTVQ